MDDEYHRTCYPDHPDKSLFHELEQDRFWGATDSRLQDYNYETPRYSIPLDDFGMEHSLQMLPDN